MSHSNRLLSLLFASSVLVAAMPTASAQSASKLPEHVTKFPTKPQSTPDRCPAGSFFDPRGECWSCPTGWHRTIFPVTASNACEKRLQIKHRPVSGKMPATGIIKTDCKTGWFLHGLSGTCYKCPTGYNRTIFGIGSNKACERIEAPRWGKARFRKTLTCGNEGNRACTVGERIPSCNPGLKENERAVCVKLERGENAFIAGLGAKSKALGNLGTEACHEVLKSVPALPMPNGVAKMSFECRRRAMIGFTCEMPGMLDQVSQFTDYAAKVSRAAQSKPCSAWSPVVRPLCAAVMGVVGDTPEVLTCVGAAIEAGAFGKLDTGDVCEASGQIAFQVATLRKLGKLKGKAKKESRLDQLKRLLGNLAKTTQGATQVAQQMDRLAECRILD